MFKAWEVMMKILCTGGAGYIGSHTAAALLEEGYEVVVADSLEMGHKKAVPTAAKLYVGDIRDRAFLDTVFTSEAIDAVVHFAAYSLVPESMTSPLKYYDNNVGGTRTLLSAMTAHDIGKIVFSSSAAVYGEPVHIPIEETDPTTPTNAYGATKLAMEQMLKWSDIAHGVKSVALRYFNACGALEDGSIGEDHNPETHLIPIVLQTAGGKRAHLSLFGRDYDTKDGTCVRDYVHVSDLASAHVLAVKHLADGGESDFVNLGNGIGFSNLEIIEAAGAVVGHKIPFVDAPRRAGDPATLVASSQKAKQLLGWAPRYTDMASIIETAWKWHRAHPNGFEDR
jgi:UDP-glucose 4-epimerase